MKKQQFQAMIQFWERLLVIFFEFMDDVLFATECNNHRLMQNLLYSGYVCDTTIKNIFAHGPDGSSVLGY